MFSSGSISKEMDVGLGHFVSHLGMMCDCRMLVHGDEKVVKPVAFQVLFQLR